MKRIDSFEIFRPTELEVVVYQMPSGEEVVSFEDCTGKPPLIYLWCLEDAVEWLQMRGQNN